MWHKGAVQPPWGALNLGVRQFAPFFCGRCGPFWLHLFRFKLQELAAVSNQTECKPERSHCQH
jgi:hypothetical protein